MKHRVNLIDGSLLLGPLVLKGRQVHTDDYCFGVSSWLSKREEFNYKQFKWRVLIRINCHFDGK